MDLFPIVSSLEEIQTTIVVFWLWDIQGKFLPNNDNIDSCEWIKKHNFPFFVHVFLPTFVLLSERTAALEVESLCAVWQRGGSYSQERQMSQLTPWDPIGGKLPWYFLLLLIFLSAGTSEALKVALLTSSATSVKAHAQSLHAKREAKLYFNAQKT